MEKKFLFSTHTRVCVAVPKLWVVSIIIILGLTLVIFRRGIVLARDIIIVSEQVEEERRVTSSLCEIKQKNDAIEFHRIVSIDR